MGNAPVKSDTNQRGSINYKSSFHGHEHAQDNHKKAAAKLNPLTEEEEVSLTDDDIRLVRMSWNTLMTKNDLRTYGTNMMIKYGVFVRGTDWALINGDFWGEGFSLNTRK